MVRLQLITNLLIGKMLQIGRCCNAQEGNKTALLDLNDIEKTKWYLKLFHLQNINIIQNQSKLIKYNVPQKCPTTQHTVLSQILLPIQKQVERQQSIHSQPYNSKHGQTVPTVQHPTYCRSERSDQRMRCHGET